MNEEQVKKIVNGMLLESQRSVSRIPYHVHNDIDSPAVPYGNIDNLPSYFCVATNTNGSATVPVFGKRGPTFNLTITGMFLISKDTTAGNISAYNGTKTIATIAKGTTAGTLVGATSLSNSTVATGHTVNVASSSAGNSTVFLTFTS